MSKQIEEVMDLVREYASESESFPTYSTLEDVELAWKAIESKLRELLPEGFVLVPVLPTEAMLKAAVMNAEGDAVYKSLEERWLKEEEQKYGAKCEKCSAIPTDPKKVHVDHIKPRKYFPELSMEESNLQVLCAICNKIKGNIDWTDYRVTPRNRGKPE